MIKLYVDGSLKETCYKLGKQAPVCVPTSSYGLPFTTNMAEYYALLRGMEAAIKQGVLEVEVYSDSELMVRQLALDAKGRPQYECKEPRLRNLRMIVLALVDKFDKFSLYWVPREDNLAGQVLERRKHA